MEVPRRAARILAFLRISRLRLIVTFCFSVFRVAMQKSLTIHVNHVYHVFYVKLVIFGKYSLIQCKMSLEERSDSNTR